MCEMHIGGIWFLHVGPVLVEARGADWEKVVICYRKAIGALTWHHGGCFAITFANTNWPREWTGSDGSKAGHSRAVFNG